MTRPRTVEGVPEFGRDEAVAAAGSGAGVDALLAGTGAVLLRGGATGAAALARLVTALGLAPLPQVEPFAPRADLGGGVWSQPAWPSTSPMCMHHELGWQRDPPPYLLVACLRAPLSGGRTGVADGRAVLSALPEDLVARATRSGWTLVRRYAPGLLGTAWTDAFGGMDAAGVEAYAAAEGVELRWEGERLVTRRHRPAVRCSGPGAAPAWSNLLAFCSEWTMEPAVRDYLVGVLGRDGLPFETEFGDGGPFTARDVETVHAAYDGVTSRVHWRPGDVLLLDNLRTAHSTEPFTGRRETAVVHAGPATRP